jgi:predicted MFS family arabinose efflux permease
LLNNLLRKTTRASAIYRQNLILFSLNARLFLAGTFFMGMGFSGFMLLFNLYLKSLGFAEGRIGNIITASTLGTLLMAVPASALIRSFSIKKILIITTPMSVLSYALIVTTSSYSILLTGGLVSGLASVFFQVAAAPFFMRHSTPRERPYLFSLNFASSLIAGVIGSLLGGYLPGLIEHTGLSAITTYRFTLYIFGGLVLVAVIPYLYIRDMKPDPAMSQMDRVVGNTDLAAPLKTGRATIIKLFFPNLITGLGAGLSIPFINLYFKSVFSLPTHLIGVFYSLSQIAMIMGLVVAPLFAEKIGKIMTVVLSQLFSIPFLIIMGLTRSLPFTAAAFLVRASLMNMAQPLFTNYAMERVRSEEQPLTNALLVIAWTTGRGLSASFGGLLIERYTYAVPFFGTSLLYLVSTALIFIFFKKLS